MNKQFYGRQPQFTSTIVIFMIILYEVELLKIYKNQSKHNLKIKLDLFVETISKIGCVTALFQLNIMGKSILVRGKNSV